MGQILLVRHGQASFGSSNYDQLSAHGQVQAGLLGRWFAQRGQRVDRVVTGTMVRHQQSAVGCIAELTGAPAQAAWQADGGFNEYDHDEILHRHRPDFSEPGEVQRFLASTENGNRAFQQIFQDAMRRWMGGAHDAEYREAWPAYRRRCVDALHRLVATAGASETAIVFTSGGTIATLCQHVLHMPDQQVFPLNWTLVNSGVTKLYHRPIAAVHEYATRADAAVAPAYSAQDASLLTLGYLNNYAHLEALGDAGAVTYR